MPTKPSLHNLTPEEQLVLAAMKLKPSTVEVERMEQLVGRVEDWNYVTRLAIDRGIGPLLNQKIPMLGNAHLVPSDVKARLQKSYMRTLARGMRLYQAFREVGTALNNANIKFVALKGVYLAEALYQDIGLRQFSDIDLLVAEVDGERSLEVLKSLGYDNKAEQTVYSSFILKQMEIVHYLPMIKEDISVEIHIKLHRNHPDYRFNIPLMLDEAVPVLICGIPAFVLNPLDMIIHLCVHAEKHFRQGHVQFTGYNDILNLMVEKTVQWDDLAARCKVHACEKPILTQILLLQEYCGLEFFLLKDTYKKNVKLYENYKVQFKHIFRGEKVNVKQLLWLFNEFKRLGNLYSSFRYFWNVLHPNKEFMINRYKIKKTLFYQVFYFLRYWEGVKLIIFKNKKK